MDKQEYYKKKVERIKSILDNQNMFYSEFKNYHLKVDGISFWCTSEKWWDEVNKIKGVGLNSFIKHVKEGIK